MCVPSNAIWSGWPNINHKSDKRQLLFCDRRGIGEVGGGILFSSRSTIRENEISHSIVGLGTGLFFSLSPRLITQSD